MTVFVLSFVVTFCYVFLRAFQQQNVVWFHYARVLPTSICMGLADVLIITIVVKTDSLWIGVTNGFAGALGCYLAMYVNRSKNLRK